MGYELNPFTHKLDKVKSEEVKDLDDRLDIITGEGQTTFYIATTGSDTTGDGTQSNPFATVDKAIEYIPINVPDNTCYTIKVANGEYDNFPNFHRNLGNNSNIIFDGYEQPIELNEEEYEIEDITSSNGKTKLSVSASMTTDEYANRSIIITSGTYIGYIFPIISNGEDYILTIEPVNYLLSGTETFKFIEPGVIFSQSINTSMSGITNDEYSSIVFYNILFTFNDSIESDIKLVLSGNFYCPFFNIKSYNGSAWMTVNIKNSILNQYVNSSLSDNLSFLNNIQSYPFGSFGWLITVVNTIFFSEIGVIDVSSTYPFFIIYESTFTYIRGVIVAGQITCSNSSLVSLQYSILSSLWIEFINNLSTEGCVIESNLNSYLIKFNNKADVYLKTTHLSGDTTYGILVDSKDSNIVTKTITTSNLTCDYFIKLDFDDKAIFDVTPNPTTGINDIYFSRSDSASAFPAAGNSVNDTECSYVAIS
jgi:hypothetical protein